MPHTKVNADSPDLATLSRECPTDGVSLDLRPEHLLDIQAETWGFHRNYKPWRSWMCPGPGKATLSKPGLQNPDLSTTTRWPSGHTLATCNLEQFCSAGRVCGAFCSLGEMHFETRICKNSPSSELVLDLCRQRGDPGEMVPAGSL